MKTLRLISVLVIVIITFSCDDSLSPKAEFNSKYSLNCIINMDTTYQVATISKTFDVDGYNPNTNTIDPFIKDAVIKINYNDTVYVMKDTSKIRIDTSRYKTPLHFYYINNLKWAEYGMQALVQATMPDGTILTAQSNIYSLRRFYLSASKREILPPLYADKSSSDLHIEWGILLSNIVNSDLYFSPELVILYSHESNGVIENLGKKVAWLYINGPNGEYPVYPYANTKESKIDFRFEAIERALQEISEGDPHKENYKIKGALFRVLLMDSNLATYYSAQKTFLDEFSVRINQPEFSNVRNGLGIVGSYAVKKLMININNNYISSFGYKY